ncbi:Yip1 family protein [Phenylobacterium montanum]|uniref:YIP1 family protein n=1 Tax=Phenylobacterium montanum TaxID=2823693 RepID=A0A975G126_9CAUL|nr:Yip1 family protein [Caulobacter sp. S6]QUD88834.1 YIP1 family protein [Caulobacter sp. S6]
MSLTQPSSVGSSDLVSRVKGILTDPRNEWDKIAGETATVGGLYAGYAVILAAIPPLARLIHGVVFGYGMFGVSYRPSIFFMASQAVLTYAFSLVMLYLIALVIDGLAGNFGGEKNPIQAFKVSVYSYTAAWVSGVFLALPFLGVVTLLGGLYSLYLLYLGLPKLMKAPQDQALGYTAVSVVVAIVLYIVAGVVVGMVTMPFALMGGGLPHGGQLTGSMHLPGGASVDMDKLNAAAKQAEIASAAIKAQENGQPPPAGAIKAVAPDALKALLPDSVAGYPRTDLSAESSAAGGFSASHADATYTQGDSRITLKVSDLGTAAGLAAMGGAFNVEASHETATGYEKTGKVDGRMTTENFDRSSKHGSYSVIVADRFVVEAEGDHVSIDQLKGAVSAVGFGRLEGMGHSG